MSVMMDLFKLQLFSLINEIFKIPNFEIVSTSGVRFTTKIGPKNGPILMKIGIHIDLISDYYHAKF